MDTPPSAEEMEGMEGEGKGRGREGREERREGEEKGRVRSGRGWVHTVSTPMPEIQLC